MEVGRNCARVVDLVAAERGAPKLRGLVARSGEAPKMRLTVYLDEETAVLLRTHCFHNGLEMSAVGAEAIRDLLSGGGNTSEVPRRIAEARDHFIADSRELVRRLDEVENEESVRQQAEADRDEVTRDAREAREGASGR
jgi:hypothetical protein